MLPRSDAIVAGFLCACVSLCFLAQPVVATKLSSDLNSAQLVFAVQRLRPCGDHTTRILAGAQDLLRDPADFCLKRVAAPRILILSYMWRAVRQVHTNGLENFWSLLKRGLHGTYVSVEPFHLFRYLDEQMFRYNNRRDADKKPVPDYVRFNLALSNILGKRLTYAELTAKLPETPF